jgi:hypothetical protein
MGRRCCKRFEGDPSQVCSETIVTQSAPIRALDWRPCGPSSATASIPRAGMSSRSGVECSGTIHLHAQDEHHGPVLRETSLVSRRTPTSSQGWRSRGSAERPSHGRRRLRRRTQHQGPSLSFVVRFLWASSCAFRLYVDTVASYTFLLLVLVLSSVAQRTSPPHSVGSVAAPRFSYSRRASQNG